MTKRAEMIASLIGGSMATGASIAYVADDVGSASATELLLFFAVCVPVLAFIGAMLATGVATIVLETYERFSR